MYGYDKSNWVTYIETICIAFVMYGFVGNTFARAVFWEKIVVAAMVAYLYWILLDINKIKVILRAMASIIWSAALSALCYVFLPKIVAVVVSLAIIYVSFKLHNIDLKKIFSFLFNFFDKKFIKKEQVCFNGYKTKHPDESYKYMQEKMKQFNDAFVRYQVYIQENGCKNPQFKEDLEEKNSSIIYLHQMLSEYKYFIDDKARMWLRAKGQEFDAYTSYIYQEMNVKTEQSGYTSSQTENTYRKQASYSSEEDKTVDESLFNGCTDAESVKKRYHQLMKLYHPDSQNGDVTMSQKVQTTYDAMMKRYGK